MRTPHQLDLRAALEDFEQATLEHERATEKLRLRRCALERLIEQSAKIAESDGKDGGK